MNYGILGFLHQFGLKQVKSLIEELQADVGNPILILAVIKRCGGRYDYGMFQIKLSAV